MEHCSNPGTAVQIRIGEERRAKGVALFHRGCDGKHLNPEGHLKGTAAAEAVAPNHSNAHPSPAPPNLIFLSGQSGKGPKQSVHS